MTVQTNNNSISYVGNGSTVRFDYDYLILDASHLKVYFGGALQTSGYAVSGVSSQTGGTVAFAVAPPDGTNITLIREVPFLQLTDYQPYDAFPVESHERALDLLTMMTQQLKDGLGRTMQHPVGGNKWDARGSEIVNVGAGNSGTSAPNIDQVKYLIASEVGGDPSASASVRSREALRRSYAEAGYNLVDGSFEAGGTLVNANDVLLQERTGKVFSGPAGTVAPGTNPVGDADWKHVTDEMLRAQLLYSVLRMQDDLFALRDLVSVKDFGAKGDGTTDDTIPLQACADYCNNNRLTMRWPDGAYRTTGTITVSSNAGLVMETRAVLQNKGSDKSFAAISIAGGGGRRRIIGTIDRYGDGIFLEGSTSNVDFQIISNCTRGVVIAALTSSNLDNVIRGVQIGLCEEGITFLQNGRRVQQGNEVRVNFVSNTKHTLVFDDQGTHTQQSNWDGNLVVLQASDPAFITGATLFWNKSGYAVPALTYAIESWAGGWNLDDNTMTAIKGFVSNCHFTFSLATGLSSSIWCELTNRGGLDSCTVNLKRKTNLGAGQAASNYAATSPGNLAGFNGGVEVTTGVFRIKLSHPDLAAGAVHGQSFYHFLSQTGNGGKFRVRQVEKGSDAGKYSIRVQDAGTEYRGMVRTWVTNITSATIPAGDIYIIVECNG